MPLSKHECDIIYIQFKTLYKSLIYTKAYDFFPLKSLQLRTELAGYLRQ